MTLLSLTRFFAAFIGVLMILWTLSSVVRSFVLPRSAPDPVTAPLFRVLRALFSLRMRRVTTYQRRDGIMAFFAPVGLLILVPYWFALMCLGYTFIYWSLGTTLRSAFLLSGSSLVTLGVVPPDGTLQSTIAYSETMLGLIVIALLIAYLPTMYNAFSQRERAVNLLEVRAGDPPSAVTLITRLHRIGRDDYMPQLWEEWESWFANVEETHTSLAALPWFRSPQAGRSWITAAGAVLDAAALYVSLVDVPRDSRADLCLRAGYLCLRSIATYFDIPLLPIPEPDDPTSAQRISITRAEFDDACSQIELAGLPMKADHDQAWQDYAGWRINYDAALLSLAAMVMAPYAPWSSDRSLPHHLRRAQQHDTEPTNRDALVTASLRPLPFSKPGDYTVPPAPPESDPE
jgi:hypothetical protein